MLSSRSDNHANRVERQILFSARKKAGAYSHYLFLALPLRPLFGLYLYLRATSLHSPLVYKHNLHMYTWRQSNTLGIAAHVHLAVLQPLMFKVKKYRKYQIPSTPYTVSTTVQPFTFREHWYLCSFYWCIKIDCLCNCATSHVEKIETPLM